MRLCSALRARGVDLVLLQPGSDLPANADFLEQAQWMRRCDLLLSVDTAAHLGGALDHPPGCCCLGLYDTLAALGQHNVALCLHALFRQPSWGWAGLIAQVLEAVDQWLVDGDWRRNSSNNV